MERSYNKNKLLKSIVIILITLVLVIFGKSCSLVYGKKGIPETLNSILFVNYRLNEGLYFNDEVIFYLNGEKSSDSSYLWEIHSFYDYEIVNDSIVVKNIEASYFIFFGGYLYDGDNFFENVGVLEYV